MKRRCSLMLSLWWLSLALAAGLAAFAPAGCGGSSEPTDPPGAAGPLVITDHAGRTVTLPAEIRSVYSISPVGTIMLYTLAPDKLAGWNYELTPDEVEYILPEYRSLSVLGGWQGKNGTGNVEAILAAKPDVILSVGDVDAAAVAVADRIQTQIQKPVVMIDYSLTKLDDAYALLGEITGAKARAADLAAYCRRVVDEAVAGAATISDKDRIAVYYAEGPKGLQTEPEGSTRTEVLELVGGKNVASVSAQSSYGRIEVSLEQVLAWHPVTILVGSDPTGETDVYKAILSSPEWATVPAVINRQVYQNPHGPFDWFDRPQSVNRVMGVRWLGQLLYPDVFTYDLKAEAKEFYKTFYYTDLNEDQLSRLLERATLALR